MAKLLDAVTANSESAAQDYADLVTLNFQGTFAGARCAIMISSDSGASWQPHSNLIHAPEIRNLQLQVSDPPIQYKVKLVDAGATTNVTVIEGAI